MERNSIYSDKEKKKILKARTNEFLAAMQKPNHTEKCLKLIDEGIDYQNILTNNYQRELLIKNANVQVIAKLLELPKIRPQEKKLMLVNAAVHGKLETVKLLSEKHGILDSDAIHTAIKKNHPDIMRYLLQHNNEFYLTAESLERLSIMQTAASWNNTDLVEILLNEFGVEPDCRQSDSRTPQQFAQTNGNLTMLELLRKHGAKNNTAYTQNCPQNKENLDRPMFNL